MSPGRKGARLAAIGALTTLVALIPAGPASAGTPNGDWAPFTRCPVDAPTTQHDRVGTLPVKHSAVRS